MSYAKEILKKMDPDQNIFYNKVIARESENQGSKETKDLLKIQQFVSKDMSIIKNKTVRHELRPHS